MLDIVLIGFDVFSAILKICKIIDSSKDVRKVKKIDPFLQKCADDRGQKDFQNNFFFSINCNDRSYSKTLLRA